MTMAGRAAPDKSVRRKQRVNPAAQISASGQQ
jgi:hypothetical protein